jgi:hypothetical protein
VAGLQHDSCLLPAQSLRLDATGSILRSDRKPGTATRSFFVSFLSLIFAACRRVSPRAIRVDTPPACVIFTQ